MMEYEEAIRFHHQQGVASLAIGDWNTATNAFREILRLAPERAEEHYHLGYSLARQGARTEAITALQEAVRLKPDLAQAHYALGNILGERGEGEHESAIREYREAIRSDPHYVNAYINLAAHLELTKSDNCLELYREAIRYNPDAAPLYDCFSRLLYMQGGLKQIQDEFRGAPSAMTCFCLGLAYWADHQDELALQNLRKAIQLRPDNPYFHIALGKFIGKEGDYEAAGEAFREAIRLAPEEHAAHFNLGYVLEWQGEFEPAMEAYRTTLRLAPSCVEAHLALGRVLCTSENRMEGRVALEKVLELDRDSYAQQAQEILEKYGLR